MGMRFHDSFEQFGGMTLICDFFSEHDIQP
jgi:hypothetical protein